MKQTESQADVETAIKTPFPRPNYADNSYAFCVQENRQYEAISVFTFLSI